MSKLTQTINAWSLYFVSGEVIEASNVILAQGADPVSVAYSVPEISSEIALNPEKLNQCIEPQEAIAVFGSSHSAVLVMKNLLDTQRCKKIINFYRSALRYAIYLADQILFDNTGLKWIAAEFAKNNLEEAVCAENIVRIFSSSENIRSYLPSCA